MNTFAIFLFFFFFRGQPSCVNDKQKTCSGHASEPKSIMKTAESNSNFSIQPSAMVPVPMESSTVQSATPCNAPPTEGEALPWGPEVIHQDTFESQGEISTFTPLACSSPLPDASEGEEKENQTEGFRSERAFISEHSITGWQKKSKRPSKRRRIGRRAPQFNHAQHTVSRPRSGDRQQSTLNEGSWEQQKQSFNQVIEIFFPQENISSPKSFLYIKKS